MLNIVCCVFTYIIHLYKEVPWEDVMMESPDISRPHVESTDPRQELLATRDDAKILMARKEELEKEIEELLKKIELLKEKIRTLKQEENSQETVAEKEEELQKTREKLKAKEKELSKVSKDIELIRRKLADTEAQVEENRNRSTQLGRREEELHAKLKVEKLRTHFLMEKAFSCANPQSHPSVEVYV